MAEKVSVIILAGGKSSRMGRDKVWMMLDGQPLIERVARRLQPLAADIVVSTAEPARFEPLLGSLLVPGQVVADRYPGHGPLAGMHAGLSVARQDLSLVVAADMPFVNIVLLQHMIGLASGYDGVVPQIQDAQEGMVSLEPLHALYRRSCLPAIEKHLAAGDCQVFRFFEDVRIRLVPPEEIKAFDPDLLSFFNVNTTHDWQEARRIAGALARE